MSETKQPLAELSEAARQRAREAQGNLQQRAREAQENLQERAREAQGAIQQGAQVAQGVVQQRTRQAQLALAEAAREAQRAARQRGLATWHRLMGTTPHQDPGLTPTLFLVVDAVPYEVAQEVFAAGHLPGFAPPLAQVSVFPSLTNVAVGTLLRAAIDIRPPGYEVKYVHTPSGEIRGGLNDSSAEPGLAPFRTRPDGAFGHVAVYAFRSSLARQQARWVSLRFQLEGGPWLGYIAATDGVAHFDGRDALVAAFIEVCSQVCAARSAYAEAHGVVPHVVLCSDHGMEWGVEHSLSDELIAERLRLEGFETGSIGPRAVLSAPMGDVGAGFLWTTDADAHEVAQLVAELPGVDLAIARDSGSTVVQGSATIFKVASGTLDRARVHWCEEGYRYEPLDGDPIGQAELFEAASWWSEAEVLAATWDHPYPDALHRIRCSLTDLVQYPASVLLSMKPGWTTGARLTHATAGLLGGQQGTHGALHRQQTLGFVACAGEGPAFEALAEVPAVRAENVMSGWRELVRAGSTGESRERRSE